MKGNAHTVGRRSPPLETIIFIVLKLAMVKHIISKGGIPLHWLEKIIRGTGCVNFVESLLLLFEATIISVLRLVVVGHFVTEKRKLEQIT